MLENIQTILTEQCRLDRNLPVIAGVSGGPDSLCLMNVLRKAGYSIIVAHFNHKLRPDADTDANIVEQTAARLNIASVIENGDVRAFADEEKLSIEEAAQSCAIVFSSNRRAVSMRRPLLWVILPMTRWKPCSCISSRGAGLSGLKGMNYRTIITMFDPQIPIVRPLLDMWREDTIVYCATHGFRPRHDPSNASLDFFRNRLRHLLIPTLKSYNPRFREVLWRTSRSLSGDHEILQEVLDDVWKTCTVQQSGDFIAFDANALSKRSVGLQRNLIRRAMNHLHPDDTDISFSTLDRAAKFVAESDQRARMNLPNGLHMLREGLLVYVVAGDATLPVERWPQMPDDSSTISLKIPGSVTLSGDWKLNCERWNIASLALQQAKSNDDPFQVWLDARGISDALELRVRQEGDRFEPFGMDGHEMKISDFFINVKLPQRARDRWPLLCMGEKVVWVPGYRPAHPFRLTNQPVRHYTFR